MKYSLNYKGKLLLEKEAMSKPASAAVSVPMSLRVSCSIDGTMPEECTASPQVYNRLTEIMAHTFWYAFEPQARLAKDAGVSRSTISRLITGKINPSFRLVQAITAALSKRISDTLDVPLDTPLDPREVFSTDGCYPTPSVCKLTGCPGCLPEEAYDRQGNRRVEYQTMQPGDWCRSPRKPLAGTAALTTAR